MAETFDEAIHEIATRTADFVISKQHDYGHGNILAFGEFGVLVRSSDKVERLKNLAKKGGIEMSIEAEYTCPDCGETRVFTFGEKGAEAALHESVEDTWSDLVGYGMIGLMLRQGTFTLPLKEDKK